MEVKKFNPAFYAVRTFNEETGTSDISLPLHAQIQWMNSEHPGWRVTSDGISIIELKDEEDGEVGTRYAVVGHVAVIDEQGRRLLSVPIDAPFRGLESGEVSGAFVAGAQLALEILGYGAGSIRREHWQELFSLTEIEEGELPQHVAQRAAYVAVKEGKGPDYVPAESIVEAQDSGTSLYHKCLSLVKAIWETNPNVFKGVVIRPEKGEEEWRRLLEKICSFETGNPMWAMLNEDEKKRVWSKLHSIYKEVSGK
ncbi:hypothetical protein [Thermovirga lienii]|jgi:hypothetical protein|uniref:hypothetical protein n=1 Tax=Thermovirga lienii TaxID=336261 RepID=UPI002FDFFAFC